LKWRSYYTEITRITKALFGRALAFDLASSGRNPCTANKTSQAEASTTELSKWIGLECSHTVRSSISSPNSCEITRGGEGRGGEGRREMKGQSPAEEAEPWCAEAADG
jgi:hypothetical protein